MFLNIFIDGASRKNPGHAGAGIYIEDDKGEPVAELKEYLGIKTNNEAEYRALLIALNHVVSKDGYISDVNDGSKINGISVFSDSQLLVRQLNGVYSVKSPNIIPLYKEAQRILGGISFNYSFKHIPRDLNKKADKLANMAIDENVAKK